ncbi:MAG: DNA primase, partial [Prevotellaceae bacterium]|nr:DNA primase [Prevotellaceae bacterium]
MITQSKIDEVKSAANIVKIISEDGITLKKSGINFIGLCPFHADRTASLVVSPTKQIFKCFACGEGGDVYKWFENRENMSYPEAVKKVAAEVGIKVEEEEMTPEQKRELEEKDSVRAVLSANQALFEGYLLSSSAASAYLDKRKVSKEMIAHFKLGFAPGQNAIKKALLEQGFREEYMLKADVIRKHAESGRTYDAYHDRIMFPIFSKRGEIVGYTGRDITDTQPGKYVNSNETILFRKGNELFGLFQAKQSIVKAGFVYVVEGQLDVISLVQHGVNNVIAGSGTAMTMQQFKLIKGFCQRIVMIYDGDAAGIHAAEKHISSCVSFGFQVSCVSLPVGLDPDDLAKQKGDNVGEWLVGNTTSYVEFLCKHKITKETTSYDKGKAIKDIVAIISMEPVEMQEGLHRELAKFGDTTLDTISKIASKVKVPEKPAEFKPGFYGMEMVSEFIDKDDPFVHITCDFEQFKKGIGESKPYLFFSGIPSTTEIQELNTKVKRVIAHKINWEANTNNEDNSVRVLKNLFTFGFTVDVFRDEDEYVGFLFRYISMYGDIIDHSCLTPEQKGVYFNRCLEMVSYAPKPIQTVNQKAWAEILGLTQADFKTLLKPYNNERNASAKITSEQGDVGDNILNYEPDKIPDYVENNEEYAKMLKRHNYFPLLGKQSQQPVCYMFRTNGGTLKRVGDFYMEPLFHVYSDDPNENRRIIKLTSLYHPGEKYVEFTSNTFTKLSKLRERLIDKGAYNFDNGTAVEFDSIWSYMSHKFPLVHEIKVFGQQPEGCFIFANGILHDVGGVWKYENADELGLMADKDMVFYSPAFSKVNI